MNESRRDKQTSRFESFCAEFRQAIAVPTAVLREQETPKIAKP